MSIVRIEGATTDRIRIGLYLTEAEARAIATAARYTGCPSGASLAGSGRREATLKRIADQLAACGVDPEPDLQVDEER